ncbi:MAG: putative Ig domain-containing protein [Planctomycetota bacterium]
MSRILTISALLCLALLLAVPVHATTYYVATNGDNQDPGTEAEPWATLQHAVDTISAGDTILVKAGTYAGCRIESSGSSGSIKTLKVDSGASVLLNSKSGSAKHNGILEIENYSAAVSYWEIDGFEVDGVSNTYRGIDCRNTASQMNSHITIKNCEVHDAYMTGIFGAFTNYILIQDCTSYDNGEHGIYVNNSSDNGDIYRNTCYSNVGNGIHMNGDESMGGDGQMSYWDVDKNTCYSNGANGINCDGVEDSKYRNNLIYENNSKGFSMYAIDGAATSNNDRILNNTVVNPNGSYYCVFIHRNSSGKGDPDGMRIYNNILYHYSTATNRGSICMHDSGFDDFDSDYNAVMEYFGINDNASQDTFSEWQTRGYDTNSIQESDTTLFDNPSSDDYHLKTGSDAIDGGTSLGDVSDDIEGTSRPQGSAFDMGCYEDAGGPPPDLEITTTSLPNGTVDVAYSETLAATGGVTPYTWSVISGSLPSGLSLASSTGVISGTPTTEETQNFTVQVTDSQDPADTDTQALSITIDPGADPLDITTTSLPDGTKKQR